MGRWKRVWGGRSRERADTGRRLGGDRADAGRMQGGHGAGTERTLGKPCLFGRRQPQRTRGMSAPPNCAASVLIPEEGKFGRAGCAWSHAHCIGKGSNWNARPAGSRAAHRREHPAGLAEFGFPAALERPPRFPGPLSISCRRSRPQTGSLSRANLLVVGVSPGGPSPENQT